VRVAKNLATRAERGEIGWAPQLRELIAFQRVVTVLGVEAATANLVGIAPEEDRDTVASVVRTVFGAAVAPLALGPQITPPTPADSSIPSTEPRPGDPDPTAPTAPAGTEGQEDPR
jgi:nitric oxide reductase NorQ protein